MEVAQPKKQYGFLGKLRNLNNILLHLNLEIIVFLLNDSWKCHLISQKYCRVPLQTERREQWIAAIEQHQKYDIYSRQLEVCYLHFGKEHTGIGPDNRIMFTKDAVPTLFPKKNTIQMPFESADIEAIQIDQWVLEFCWLKLAKYIVNTIKLIYISTYFFYAFQ